VRSVKAGKENENAKSWDFTIIIGETRLVRRSEFRHVALRYLNTTICCGKFGCDRSRGFHGRRQASENSTPMKAFNSCTTLRSIDALQCVKKENNWRQFVLIASRKT
jgi:hypothetical protein